MNELNPDRPTVPEVAALAQFLYKMPDHAVGGCMHVVLDDNNIEDDNIRHCIDTARKSGCILCAAVGFLLIQMTSTQRSKVCRLVYDDHPDLTNTPYFFYT